MELRKLKAPDIFIVTTIASKIGIKKLGECFRSQAIADAVQEGKGFEAVGITVGFEIAGTILENLEKCDNEIYLLVSRLSGLSDAEVRELDGAVLLDIILDIIEQNKADFIKVASRFFKSVK